MTDDLRDVTGFRGEKIVELRLTDYSSFSEPLFRPGFLGDKWPAIDFYVELRATPGQRFYFFAQAKSTRRKMSSGDAFVLVNATRDDVQRLKEVVAPTYIFGVHEPSQRVFISAVHAGTPKKAVKKIPSSNELTVANLQRLYDEVQQHWTTTGEKPAKSVFG
jgi:hypothetical protein